MDEQKPQGYHIGPDALPVYDVMLEQLRWFDDSPDAGDPDCLCSLCGGLIEEEDDPLRLTHEGGDMDGREARLHIKCWNQISPAPIDLQEVEMMRQLGEQRTSSEIEEDYQHVLCCGGSDHKVGERGQHVNVVVTDRVPEWDQPVGYQMSPWSGPYAVAVMCDQCIEAGQMPSWVIRRDNAPDQSPGEYSRVALERLRTA